MFFETLKYDSKVIVWRSTCNVFISTHLFVCWPAFGFWRRFSAAHVHSCGTTMHTGRTAETLSLAERNKKTSVSIVKTH